MEILHDLDPIDYIKQRLLGGEEVKSEIINLLSESDRITLTAKLAGFRKMPPSITDFIEDDYYLGHDWGHGKLYKYWYSHLQDICPNPISQPYLIINPGGALGIGKSTISQILSLYTLCKMGCLVDPSETFGLGKSTPFTQRYFNLSIQKAWDVLINPINEQIDRSPYFSEFKRENRCLPGRVNLLPAKNAGQVISECLIFALVSETNFFPFNTARDIVDTCINRMNSRLQKVRGIFGTVILDSSAKDKDSYVEKFLEKGEFASVTKVIRASIWEVKPDAYFKNGSFKVYAGSSEVSPHIIEDNEDTSEYDQDRIITVPNELYMSFKTNIEKCLQDSAGICIDSVGDFFTDKEAVTKAVCLPQMIEDELVFDFYDDEQIYDRIGKKILKELPQDRKLYVRLDLGITGDRAGLAIGHIDDICFKKINDIRMFIPKVKIPVAFGLSRYPGQETSIHKITEFILWLSRKRDIAWFSSDQYQSTAIRQILTEHGIRNSLISVDRTDQAYVELKTIINRGNIKIVDNKILLDEALYIKRIGNKIDHLPDKSKDILDCVAGIIKMINEDGEKSADVPEKVILSDYNKDLSDLIEKNKKRKFLSGIGIVR